MIEEQEKNDNDLRLGKSVKIKQRIPVDGLLKLKKVFDKMDRGNKGCRPRVIT